MSNDIDLYIDSVYCGFWELSKIEEYFDEYYSKAHDYARQIDWDEIILYAVLCFDGEKQTFISADFMLLRMEYERYIELCDKLSKNCRLFFVSNRF